MLQPEVYARKSRRWGVAAIGSYVAFLGTTALGEKGFLNPGVLVLSVLIIGIVCMITTCISLIRWTQNDMSNGRFFSRPGRSLLIRLAPGFGLLCAAAYPDYNFRGLMFISWFIYSLLTLLGETYGSDLARKLAISPPPVAVVGVAMISSLYASFLCFMLVGMNPLTMIDIAFSIALLIFGIVVLLLLKYGSHKGEVQTFVPTWLFYRPLMPRERLALGVSAGLDFIVAAFAFWMTLNIYL